MDEVESEKNYQTAIWMLHAILDGAGEDGRSEAIEEDDREILTKCKFFFVWSHNDCHACNTMRTFGILLCHMSLTATPIFLVVVIRSIENRLNLLRRKMASARA